MKFYCTVHQVTLVINIEKKERHIIPPVGSFGYPCRLVSDPEPHLGKMGNCEIVEVE